MKQLEMIIERLIKSTKDNAIDWTEHKTSSEKRFTFEVISNDEETKFNLDIDLDENLNLKSDSYLWIYNKDLVDGKKLITHYQYKSLNELKQIVFDKYVKNNLKKHLDQGLIFESILDKIADKQYTRDEKIKDILEDSEEETKEVKEVKSEKKWWKF